MQSLRRLYKRRSGRSENGRRHRPNAHRADDGSRDSAGLRAAGSSGKAAAKIRRWQFHKRYVPGVFPAHFHPPVFFFRGDWTGARYFQNLRNRFSGRTHHVDSDELHRNLFLHDVCLFYDGARFQIQIYAGRRAVFYRRRCRYERAAGIPDVNFHKNSGQLRIERCVTARLQTMLLFSIQMLYQQSIFGPSPCKKPLPQTY